MRVRIGVLLTLLVVSGCGAGPMPHPKQAVPTATVSATADGNGSAVPPLPTLPPPTTPAARGSAAPAVQRYGADVSWPQCPVGMGIPQKRSLGLPMPPATAGFVVLGLTNGPSFVANPCLASQVARVRSRHLLAAAYAVVSYPDALTLRTYRTRGPYDGRTSGGALANTGYRAALFDIATMRRARLRSPVVWIDVESVPDFAWSPDLVGNADVVRGAARGFSDAGYTVGFYSTPSLWTRVVGDLALHLPEWRAAGQTSLAEALSRCGDDWSFGGGTGVLGQWVAGSTDLDVTCPGQVDPVGTWFHQY
ncbi:MAG: hypothetical protein JWP74_2565 [Marmoricola sp.]|nr:hypothetical protein [Marmoricola sp.]